MMDHLLTKNTAIKATRESMKISKQSSDVDFAKIMTEMKEE